MACCHNAGYMLATPAATSQQRVICGCQPDCLSLARMLSLHVCTYLVLLLLLLCSFEAIGRGDCKVQGRSCWQDHEGGHARGG
jgi:hypothetical protein